MMRLSKYLIEMANDPDDWGKVGRDFERVFTRACELLGLRYEKNSFTGRIWDMKPVGPGWERILLDKDVNIKAGGTKWMFSSSEIYKELPWDDDKPEDFDTEVAAQKVKKILRKFGIDKTVFLKPANKDIQNDIYNAVKNEDIETLEDIFTSKNFYAEKLGTDYSVRVIANDTRVTSVAIDKGGKVFMRSEKPRKLGMGGTITVTFRTPTPKIGRVERKVKA
jgi:hypothetical protein